MSRAAARQLGLLRTIRVRLTLWYVLLLGCILALFGVFLHLSLTRSLSAELDRSLATAAQQIVASSDFEPLSPRLGQWSEVVPPGMVAALYDRGGQRLIANDARQPVPVLAEALARAAQGQQTYSSTLLRDGSQWRVLTAPLTQGGRLVGVLQVARPEAEVQLALDQLVTLMAVAVPLTLLLAVAGGLFLAGRALNPIDQIVGAAEQIGAEDLSRRLRVPPTGDELARLAATFNRMLGRLDEAFQRQRQFTADASHELRTPLALLASQADLALSRERSPAEYRAALASIREDTDGMSRLLGALLTLSRADAGQEALELEPLPLADLACDVAATLEPLAEARGVRLACEAADPVVVRGDQTRLTQLLVNLVDNGLKYTPAGGAVTVSVGHEPGRAVLRVADSGPGIAPEHLPHLFERFYRVDKARARSEGGAGLGLAIARWIARAHDGDIVVESRLGHGTTFTLRLPSAEPA